jgi:hypothetical protein
VGKTFEISVGEPEGGVDLSSLRFELVAPSGAAPTLDAPSRDRLRQLGYAPD